MRTDISSNSSLEQLTYEMVLRENLLSNALMRATPDPGSTCQKDFESLRSDLEANQTALHEISGGLLFPSIAAIASSEARHWGNFLTEALSDSSCRWNRVFSLCHELEEILALHRQFASLSPRVAKTLEPHLRRIEAHYTFHRNILDRWISTERQRGNPIDDLLLQSQESRREAWEKVIEDLLKGGRARFAMIPSFSWRSLENAVREITHRMLDVIDPSEKRQARVTQPPGRPPERAA